MDRRADFRCVHHRRPGKNKASTLDARINYRHESRAGQSPAMLLRQVLTAPSLQGFIDAVAPSGPIYRGLQAWLARYRVLVERDGLPAVPLGPNLRALDGPVELDLPSGGGGS